MEGLFFRWGISFLSREGVSNGEGIGFDGEWGVEKLEGWGGGRATSHAPPPTLRNPYL